MKLVFIILITLAVGTLIGSTAGFYTIQNRTMEGIDISSSENLNFQGFEINPIECKSVTSGNTQFLFSVTNNLESDYYLSLDVHLMVDQTSLDSHTVNFNIKSSDTKEFKEILFGDYENSVCTILMRNVDEITD